MTAATPNPGALHEVAFGDIHLRPGTLLQIQTQGENVAVERHSVRYVGCIERKSVLVGVPVVDDKVLWVQPGTRYTVRFFSNTTAYAFSTHVLRARTNPAAYMHLAWPRTVQARAVRRASRIQTDLPCTLAPAEGPAVPARLVDLSLHGAMVEAEQAIWSIGDKLTLGFAIQAAYMNAELKLPTCIRNETVDPQRYGLEFDSIPDELYLPLRHFIEHRILEEELPQASLG